MADVERARGFRLRVSLGISFVAILVRLQHAEHASSLSLQVSLVCKLV